MHQQPRFGAVKAAAPQSQELSDMEDDPDAMFDKQMNLASARKDSVTGGIGSEMSRRGSRLS